MWRSRRSEARRWGEGEGDREENDKEGDREDIDDEGDSEDIEDDDDIDDEDEDIDDDDEDIEDDIEGDEDDIDDDIEGDDDNIEDDINNPHDDNDTEDDNNDDSDDEDNNNGSADETPAIFNHFTASPANSSPATRSLAANATISGETPNSCANCFPASTDSTRNPREFNSFSYPAELTLPRITASPTSAGESK